MQHNSGQEEYKKAVSKFFKNIFLFSIFPIGVIANIADIQTTLLCIVVYIFIFFLGYTIWQNNSKDIETHLSFAIFLFAVSSLACILVTQIAFETLVITELVKWIWASWIVESWKREYAKYYEQ